MEARRRTTITLGGIPMSLKDLDQEFECDHCGHTWSWNFLEMLNNTLSEKELEELKRGI